MSLSLIHLFSLALCTLPTLAAVGDINCRYTAQLTPAQLRDSPDPCSWLANKYGISISKFFMLNPELSNSCEEVREEVEYCVAGFLEELLSTNGFCGPEWKNASCVGTDFGQCCNGETWKCGETRADCTPPVCYSGACIRDFGPPGTRTVPGGLIIVLPTSEWDGEEMSSSSPGVVPSTTAVEAESTVTREGDRGKATTTVASQRSGVDEAASTGAGEKTTSGSQTSDQSAGGTTKTASSATPVATGMAVKKGYLDGGLLAMGVLAAGIW
ncbi:hypothetical protein GQ43DRAFT_439535 [Delitschia confertaspora ATCC 74209]|uniref:LysM domain-containing protein n=1 Tax=Delitschia confertaspora ATCC 74209 TaxID=1513339 RepID=A0A9P4MR68_9PLEO|nr:hypothetical protein GQ43DRAFT_439535 [Delitschia confertaspora ATCC 74209]